MPHICPFLSQPLPPLSLAQLFIVQSYLQKFLTQPCRGVPLFPLSRLSCLACCSVAFLFVYCYFVFLVLVRRPVQPAPPAVASNTPSLTSCSGWSSVCGFAVPSSHGLSWRLMLNQSSSSSFTVCRPTVLFFIIGV